MLEDWSYNKVIKYQEIQKQLISYCYSMLKPGGTMVYSTCSFSKEEDEDVIHYLIDNSDASILEIPNNDLFYVNKKDPLGIHLFPSLFPGEGHYICLIKKPGELKESKEEKVPDYNIKNQLIKNACTRIHKYGDTLFGCDKNVKNKGLNIIRNGVKVGEIINDFVKYDYHFAHYVSSFTPTFALENTELEKYFKGEILSVKSPSGYLLCNIKASMLTSLKVMPKLLKIICLSAYVQT